MTMSWALFYGLIQGISEFLPVSSSGHLALIPYFFKLKDPGVLFDLVMHLGTAIAVILYFHRELKILMSEAFLFFVKRNTEKTKFFQNFTLSTIVSFIFILGLKPVAFQFGRAPIIIGINFVVFGFLMYLSDRSISTKKDLTKEEHFLYAVLIGAAQAFAIFPGVSRSGITLTVARGLKLSRIQASRYSFLLSLPIILGSIIFKLPSIIKGDEFIGGEPLFILVGVIASFVFGMVTIHYFLKLIAKIGLIHFAIYRIFIGALLIYFAAIN